MQLKTILNRVEKQKGFVYSEASMTKGGEIEFTLRHRGILRLPDAAGGLPQLWRDHRTSSLGLRQQSAIVLVSNLFGHVGETLELEGDSEHFRNQLG
jgi:hypothetical protein